MRQGGWPLVSAKEMQALDAHTIDVLGVPGDVLMERAGFAIADAVVDLVGGDTRGPEILVVCGRGNNGGDGWVVTRRLLELGYAVRVCAIGVREGLGPDGEQHRLRAEALGVAVLDEVPESPGPVSVVVDALFGTGLSRTIEGAEAAAIVRIAELRREGALVVAADIPSGLCADTGQPLGACVSADVTVTMELPKLGLWLEPGRTHAGRLRVAPIGIAASAPGFEPKAHALTRAAASSLLPARPDFGHKGTFGHVLVVAGSEGKTGAAALAARAALRGGAGLVTLACPASLNDILEPLLLEAMTAPLPDTPERGLAARAEDALLRLAHARSVVALGPGLGTSTETVSLVRSFVCRCERPLILDADGLNALGAEPELLRDRGAPAVLTPHPGEAARLLGISAVEVNSDRIGHARALAARADAVVVLKGAPTVTAEPDGTVTVNTTGGPALAVGGTGDVLTGLIAALVAQGLSAARAGALGAFVHGCGGDRIAARQGSAGLLASDLADELPAAQREVREAAPHVLEPGPLLDFPES